MLKYMIASPGFKASLPQDKLIFNHEIATDIMWLEGTPIMHTVDTRRDFQNVVVLRGKKPEELWMSFIECCPTVYADYSVTIGLDLESGSAAEEFRNLATVHVINLQFSGAQSLDSVGGGEINHEQLRRYFHILRSRYQSIEPELLLWCILKWLNNTMRRYGFLRSLLVFGSLPTFPMLNKTQPVQAERMQITWVTRNDIT